MKKSIMIVALFLASVSFAQVSFDARAGVNLSGISEGDLSMKFGVKVGGGIHYELSELVALKSGLFYTMKGVTDAKTPFAFSPDNTYSFNYFEIPVLASLRFNIVENFGIALNAGPSFSYLVSKVPEDWKDVSSFDIGANMGIDFLLNENFLVGVESQYGILELLKDSNHHNINYSLICGYRF